jgi:hypothetical protein
MQTPNLFLTCFLTVFLAVIAQAQVFNKPDYEVKKSPSELKLHKIEITKKYTICEISYIYEGNDSDDANYIYIIPDMHIIDVKTSEKFYVIKSENIPMYPKQYQFKKKGEVLRFKVYFPPIDPKKIVLFHIVEEVDRGFKFFGIHLYPFA